MTISQPDETDLLDRSGCLAKHSTEGQESGRKSSPVQRLMQCSRPVSNQDEQGQQRLNTAWQRQNLPSSAWTVNKAREEVSR